MSTESPLGHDNILSSELWPNLVGFVVSPTTCSTICVAVYGEIACCAAAWERRGGATIHAGSVLSPKDGQGSTTQGGDTPPWVSAPRAQEAAHHTACLSSLLSGRFLRASRAAVTQL